MTMPSNRSGNPVHTWRVTGQQEVTQLGSAGAFVQGYKVMFALTTGQTGSVFVPRTSYTPAAVRTAISEWAARVGEIGGLTG